MPIFTTLLSGIHRLHNALYRGMRRPKTLRELIRLLGHDSTSFMLRGKDHSAPLDGPDNANSCNEYIIPSDTGCSTRSETILKKMSIGFWHRIKTGSCILRGFIGVTGEGSMWSRRALAIYHFVEVTSRER